ncbi:hypothetical protein B0I35DRAFT_494599 [Stachybotrys elegans]|uniref:Uncharacterized protein n=1 Tax=Stachybotrys elegans TaxID=80388 RepID=A0A8K0WK93_9HYPO|nr:hypothetical protein B0I35DRAFT_494599 [Stachybotrys elegans]
MKAKAILARNRRVLPASLQPLSSSRGTDYIELYQKYGTVLHFQANSRPQRRLFLAMNALQEELGALVGMHRGQQALLSKYAMLTSPQSFRITDKTRIRLHATERTLAREQQRRLTSRISDIEDLLRSSRYPKESVKQIIEVIDEDHGKAIRVFTMVILFFLPLSFIYATLSGASASSG